MKKITCLVVVIVSLLFSFIYAAQDMSSNTLSVIANISEEGILNVCETWKINAAGNDFLERRIYIDKSKNEKVENINIVARYPDVSGERKFELYSGDLKFGRYAIEESGEYYFIRCGVDKFNSNVIYDISYTIVNNLVEYKDCTEMKWYIFKNDILVDIGSISRRDKFSDFKK